MSSLHRQYGDLLELSIGPKKLFFCFHPDHAERILKSEAQAYRRSRLVFDKILPLTGKNGLVQLEGDIGRKQRLVTGPSFSFEAIREAYPSLLRSTLSCLKHLDQAASEKREIDLAPIMMKIALKNALIFIFGEELGPASDDLAQAFIDANGLCGARIRNMISIPDFVPTKGNRKLKKSIEHIDRVIYSLIDQYVRQHGTSPQRKDLLSNLLRAGAPRNELRDQVVTFLFAGHETTASSLTWAFYLLAKHAAQAEKARNECVTQVRTDTPRFEDLRGLSYTLNVYQESLRLFPPSWTLARESVLASSLNGHPIPKGALLLLGVGEIQSHANFWNDGNHFVPERFESDLSHPYAYIPFGGGSRICIGMRTALIEATLVLALVLPRFRLHVRPDFEAEMEAMITAHPRSGLPVTVERLES